MIYIISGYERSNFISQPFLHASKEKGINYHHLFNIQMKLGKKLNIKKKNIKREMNISADKKTAFEIYIFSEFLDEKKGFLAACDLFWINLSELDVFLIFFFYDKYEKLTLIGDSVNVDKSSSHSFKFIGCETTEKFKKFIGNPNGLFVIESNENSEKLKGGYIEWEKKYKLRHLW